MDSSSVQVRLPVTSTLVIQNTPSICGTNVRSQACGQCDYATTATQATARKTKAPHQNSSTARPKCIVGFYSLVTNTVLVCATRSPESTTAARWTRDKSWGSNQNACARLRNRTLLENVRGFLIRFVKHVFNLAQQGGNCNTILAEFFQRCTWRTNQTGGGHSLYRTGYTGAAWGQGPGLCARVLRRPWIPRQPVASTPTAQVSARQADHIPERSVAHATQDSIPVRSVRHNRKRKR